MAIISATTDRSKMLVTLEGPEHPPTLHIYDAVTHHFDNIGEAYPALTDLHLLGDMKPYNYKARDGLDIPAFLTLPLNKEAKNLPFIVMPHGGPEDRDYERFDWLAQFLVEQGLCGFAAELPRLARLWLRIRTSRLPAMGPEDAGRHHRRPQASHCGWHRRSETCLHPGLELWRLCGARRCNRDAGALRLRGQHRRRIRRAAAAGRDAAKKQRINIESEAMVDRFGKRWDDQATLKKISPVYNAANVRAPVLLIHGDKD